ncbi:ATP-binding protein [Crenobacter cavernae]|uniref:histidine kinase n=1 Tax=Crenobacter cavernae TaxID=2290923 RepID=A0ABY0FCF6_9NEIS|nr:ATP-binding protein [Crenobacter cavernae]RXZ43815.1 HAMP domain-containing protein [Crenobacter cavernae]
MKPPGALRRFGATTLAAAGSLSSVRFSPAAGARRAGGLFGRIALLLVVAVLASQAFTLWLTVRQREDLLAEQLYAQVVDTLADLEGMLDTIPRDDRTAFLSSYNRPGLPQLLPLDAAQRFAFSDAVPHLGMQLAGRLATNLSEPVEVRWRQVGERRELWLAVQVVDARYWLVMPLGRFLGPPLSPTLIASAVVAFVALLAAFALAWRVTRPLSKLADASRELGAGGTPAPIEPAGPREIREFTAQFNRMVAHLDAAASERRLMLAGLSHDLRTPLTRLKLTLELQPDNPDRPDMLDDIDELSRIVNQFIDFARSEEGGRMEPVTLAELADSVVARFVRGGLAVRFEREAEPELVADALALERMLSNLIDNARRYGATPITVTLAEGAGMAELTVHDRGRGIPPAAREAALAPFERLAPQRGHDGGSGLGLAIVSRVVQQHGGMLLFIDPPQGGFAIRVRLPLQRPTAILPA